MAPQSRIYIPSKTGELYHADNTSRVKLIFGHVASGKSSTNCIEIMKLFMQLPICKDGVRRGKWMICRNTYPKLKLTTVPTWLSWFPESQYGRMYRQSPFLHPMRFKDQYGVHCELDVYFLSLESSEDTEKLLSLEPTGFFFNELSEMPKIIIDKALTRLMCRYPSKEMLGLPDDYQGMPYHQCVLSDTNPPPARSWIKECFENKPLPGWKIYKQPAAMILTPDTKEWVINPERENKVGVPDEAVLQAGKSLDPETFKVYILGEYASVFDGKPVHPSYKAHVHFSKEVIDAVENEPLYLGWDFGLTPAMILGQFIQGQLRVLEEFISSDMDLSLFLQTMVMPVLNRKYSQWISARNFVSTADPAGMQRAQATGAYCLDILNKNGLNSSPARTNSPIVRRGALDVHLNRMVNGAPGMIVSSNCTFINDALVGGYRYRLMNDFVGGELRYTEVPDKNEYSHGAEACQYMAMPLEKVEQAPLLKTIDYYDGEAWRTRFEYRNQPNLF